jgi:hypothetical protein
MHDLQRSTQERKHQMSTADRRRIRKEEKKRRKKLLRAFREDERTKVWNRVLDEVGPCNKDCLELDCDASERLDRTPNFELEDLDEDYPNKAETMHNIF